MLSGSSPNSPNHPINNLQIAKPSIKHIFKKNSSFHRKQRQIKKTENITP